MKNKPIDLLFDAMYHGKYDFQDFANCDVSANYETVVFEDKAKSKIRVVQKPNKKLRAYHTFLNLFLFDYLNVNSRVVFSYLKGVSAFDAVEKHSRSKYFFQTDIVSFFPSIDTELIRNTILGSCSKSPIQDVESILSRVLEFVVVNNALPMGFSTSPTLSNACLFDFDVILEGYCQSNNLVYTRYADDITISSESQENIEGIALKVDALLNELFGGKLALNQSKSKSTHVGRKIKILGMVILPTGKITVDIKFKNDLEVLLHFYLTDKAKFINRSNGDMGAGIARITGLLNYVNTVDKSYLDKLRKKFGATIVDTLLHQSAK